MDLYLDVFCFDPRSAPLDYDHWSADPPAITGNVNCLLVMVDVGPYELVDLPCSPQLPEIADKASCITGDANDGAIDMNDEGSRRIDLRPRC